MACSRMLSFCWEDVNSPCDINPGRAWKYTLDHRDTPTQSVHGEHMVLMLCAHNVDGLTQVSHRLAARISPFPNVPLGCDKKHRGLDHTAQCQILQPRRDFKAQSYRTSTHTRT